MNYSKIEYMRSDPGSLYIDGNLIKNVESFRYLGPIMKVDGSSNMDIRKRTCDGQRSMGILNLILWSRNIINRNKAII